MGISLKQPWMQDFDLQSSPSAEQSCQLIFLYFGNLLSFDDENDWIKETLLFLLNNCKRVHPIALLASLIIGALYFMEQQSNSSDPLVPWDLSFWDCFQNQQMAKNVFFFFSEDVFLLETEYPKSLLVYGLFTSSRYGTVPTPLSFVL